MIPVLSCMQIAVSVSGAGGGEETSSPDDEAINTQALVTDVKESGDQNICNQGAQDDIVNNNEKLVAEHTSSEHNSSEHTSSEHTSSEHTSPEHTSSEHTSSEHTSPEHTSSEHTSSEHNSSEHTSSEHTSSVEKQLNKSSDTFGANKSDSLSEVDGETDNADGTNGLGETSRCSTEVGISEHFNIENINEATKADTAGSNTSDNETLKPEQHQSTRNDQGNAANEEIIKPKKSQLSCFLTKSYYDENAILSYGSVDVADNAHIELELLQEKTRGKSWTEELNETADSITGSLTEVEKAVEDVNVNTTEAAETKEAHILHATDTNHTTNIEINNESNTLDRIEEIFQENRSLKSSSKTKDTEDQESKDIENIEDSLEENIFAERSESLSSPKDRTVESEANSEVSNSQPKGQDSECFEEIISESNGSVIEDNKDGQPTDDRDYDADSSDTETAQVERTNEVKAALLSYLKGKCEIFERVDIKSDSENEADATKQVTPELTETLKSNHNGISETCPGIVKSVENKGEELEQSKDKPTVDGECESTLSMPETRDHIDGSISPSLMFACCRYRWEKTIFSQAQRVVFVTLNKKDIDPIQLEWSESSRCFYSDEIKIPVGAYVGNLVIDGTFYPVEDIVVKHYTFEVDLYLKDDILEDEAQGSGLAKAEEFIKQKSQTNGQDTGPDSHSKDYSYTSNRAGNFTYPSTRARMEEEPVRENSAEGNINVTSKYEELVRSQMNQNKGTLNNYDANMPLRSDYSDLEGRRTPVGEDGEKQFQDSDNTNVKTTDRRDSLENNGKNISKQSPSIDDFFEQKNTYSSGPVQNGYDSLERRTSPAVIDDVLGNGHTRTPIYSTESPVYSKHSSAHSSARQTPTTGEGEQQRPASVGSVGSVHSAGSLSKHVLDDLLCDALGRPRIERTSPASDREGSRPASTTARPESVGSAHSDNFLSRRAINDLIEDSLNVTKTPPPSKESSVQGSRPQTPPPQEQIDDVLNPADRHSPIRREFLAGSPSLSNHSTKGSLSGQSSAHSSQRQTPQRELISNSLHASQEKLYSSHSPGSNTSSRPQSLTSEQELTQYYDSLTDGKNGEKMDMLGTAAPRTGSASSLPAITSQQRYTPDKRSMTPDNHIRVPVVGSAAKLSLLPSRTPPRTPLSNASSRTVTPINTETDTEFRLKEQVKDLENTICNLRKLLTSREQEVSELKDQFAELTGINEKLQGDLDRHRARASPGPQIAELERKVREALSERDSLNAEISILREELRKQKEPGLNSYNPNSPSALQRKIDELNSHIQDLQEAHDAASEEIQAAERKVKQLAAENETLRVTQSDRMRDVEDENRHLKSEVQRLKESHVSYSDATDYRLKIELQQIKEDNRNLRERNYQLHDENIRMKEELSDLRKTLEFMDRKAQQKDERTRQYEAYERSDTDRVMKASYHSDLGYSRLSEPSRRTDREFDGYTMSRSNYDTQGPEQSRDDYMEDRLTKSDSMRYESFRTGPDGGSSDKLRSSLGYSQPLTPERPSSLGTSKWDSSLSSKNQEKVDLASRTVDRSDLDLNRARRERNRTSSAEIEFRSAPLATYHGDLSKTTPALSGRSRAIYKELSDLRSRAKTQSEDAGKKTIISDSGESDSNPKTENSNNQSNQNKQAHSSQVFMNRFVPQTPVSEVEETNTDARRLQLAEKLDSSYARREAKATHQRQTLEKEVEMLEKQAEKQALLSSLPIVTKSGYCDDGNMSDTPTDILVNIKPVDKIQASTWSKGHQRRGSIGSDASNSSFSDIDEQITASVRRRSKSADGREILRRMGPTGSSSKENLTLTRTLSPAPSAGLRTITPRPIPTQHNKSSLTLSSSLNSLTQGLRPFAPRSAQDLQINDVIKFSRQGGKLSQGTIKFIGHLPGRGDIYLGVELDKEDGKHDGVFEGIRYFKCKPSKGVFVAYNKVVMAWTSY